MEKVSKNFFLVSNLVKSSKVALIIFLEVVLGILLSASSLFIFIKIRGEVLEQELSLFDNSIINFFYSLRIPFLTKIMVFISFLGGEFIIAATILIIILLFLKKHKKESVIFAFIIEMSFLINSLLKNVVQRPRPHFHPLIVENNYSFPSGHAMDSFVFYTTLSYLVFHFTRNKKLGILSIILSTILIFLIGISRIYLGVHYPTDVIAGYFGGLFWFASVMLIDRTLIFFKFFKESKDKIINKT